MLDPLYFAVSGVMWCWHQLFGFLLGPASGAAWALSVVFLVLTLRALLIRPFLAQVRSGRVMRALAPQLAELRERHADDRARLLEKTRELQSAHGVSAAGMLGPALLQVPVFLGLLHVLTHFNRRGLTFEQNAALANYAFGPDEVRSFLTARLFGAPISSYLSMPQQLLDSFGAHVDRADVALVAVPLMVLAAVATHLSTRLSVRQQTGGPAAALMRWMPWIFPVGVLVGGAFFPFPIAILLYWFANSVWTLGQQWAVLRPEDLAPVARAAAEPPVPARTAPRRAAAAPARSRSSGHRPRRGRR